VTTPAPTFYAQIAANRRASWLLAITVGGLLALLAGVTGYALGIGWIGVPVALVITALVGVFAYFGGAGMILGASDAHLIDPAKPPEGYQQLVNVVEEMRLASGAPMPRLYVINDTAPNAFATGRDPRHASLAVTTGLLTKLDREELQGVIGHEMSHIRNFDTRFMLLIGVMVGAIAIIADWFLHIARWGGGGGKRDSDSGKGGAGLILVVVWVVAILLSLIAPLVARLVLLAASRRRESLADVSAVELTRNPMGLAHALRKIANDTEVLEAANHGTQHLFVVNPIKTFEERASSMSDTHPPIGERIRLLESMAGAAGES
jgi:heat shock protein HtpX